MKRTLVVSDIHVPANCPAATATFLQFTKDFAPHELILNGDIMDMQACSGHADADPATSLAAEIQAGCRLLDSIRQAAGSRCHIHYNEGNHETRLSRFLLQNAPSFRGVTSLPALLQLRQRNITWLPYTGDDVYFVTKKLGVTHGSFHGANYTRSTLRKYGVSLIVGHAHRPEYSTEPVVGIDGQHIRGCWGSGCLVPVDRVSYMQQPSGWSQGWTVVYSDPQKSGDFTVYPITLANGCVWWNGKRYGKPQRGR